MSFDKELKVVMIASLGLLAYLGIASAVMGAIHYAYGQTAFLVAWLVVLIIPANFALCSLVSIVFYKRKEKNFNEVKEHLTKLSDLSSGYEKYEKYDKIFEKSREEKSREGRESREEKSSGRSRAASSDA